MGQLLRRLHIWLGWIVGIPLLIWTVTGAIMVLSPGVAAHGDQLLSPPPPIALVHPAVVPPTAPRRVTSLTLEQRAAGPRWLVRFADGEARLADPTSGRVLPPLSAAEATAEVQTRYKGDARIAGVGRVVAEDAPVEPQQSVEAWRVMMSDGTRFYVDAATGEIAARRTALWRLYDFVWGLHIMDLGARENVNNGWVGAFSVIAALSVVLSLILLPIASWRKRRPEPTVAAD